MVLSQMVFPSEGTAEKRILYYRGKAEPHIHDGLELPPDVSVRFDTYFNAFFYGAYAEHTHVKRVRVCTRTTGTLQIRLFSVDKQNCETPLTEVDVSGGRTTTELPQYALADLPPNGALFLEMTAHAASAWLHSGWYEAEADCRPVRIAAVICTYRREAYVYRNLRSIREKILENPACPARDDIDILVIDNGKSIQTEEHAHIFAFPNRNCGGSGGFTRGMLEACQRGQYTHVLLMDDDISFEPEALVRTVQFLKAAKPTERPLCVGGQMLLENRPTIQFEAGSSYLRGRLSPNGHGADLSDRAALLTNSPSPSVQYNAWWYCCLPLAAIEKYGFPLPLFIKTDDVEYGLRLKPQVALLNGVGVWHTAFSDKYSPYLEYYIKRNELIVSAIHGSGAGVFPSLKKLIRTSGRAWLKREPLIIHFTICACLDFLGGPDFLLQTDGETLHIRLMAEGKTAPRSRAAALFTETLRLFPALLQMIVRYRWVRGAYQARWRELTTETFWRRYLDLDEEGTNAS